MYANFFTKPLHGPTFRRLQDMIQGIAKSTPDIEMSCPIAMAKVISQEFVGQN